MAGINSEVYDIFHPTPVSLKDLSAMAVSLGIWRCEVTKYLMMDDALETFDPTFGNISSKSVLPDLPSVIHATIDKYVTEFGSELEDWLSIHHERVFYPSYYHQNCILAYFEDFVCDYNGTIHYVRTAERMLHHDQFDVYQKFVIACTYFFEDDIRRLWPLVSSNMDWNSIKFTLRPELYYWICYLKNELHKIPTTGWWDNDRHVDDVMFNLCMTHNRPSVEYFWNRMTTENRRRNVNCFFDRDVESFAGYILPKLDDQTLDEFINSNEGGFKMMLAVYRCGWYDKEIILSIWMRIRNVINERVFTNETIFLLQFENGDIVLRMRDNGPTCYDCFEDDEDGSIRKNWFNLCCEIWNSAPERLKRSAVKEIISNNRLYGDSQYFSCKSPPKPKEYEFFSTFLSYATYEERRTFWSVCWKMLIRGTRCNDFKKLMNLCFENEDEINQFKENVIATDDNIQIFCTSLPITSYFDEVNDLASFLFSNVQAARNFKQQLLQEYLDEDDIFDLIINDWKKCNQFIDDAYANADLSANFKNQLMSLPSIQQRFSQLVSWVPVEELVELRFIERFVLSDDTLQQIKARLIKELKRRASSEKSVISESSVTSFLSWCLGSNEEVEKFKMVHL